MGPKQIILRLNNTPGQLSVVSDLLGRSGVDIKAVSISIDGQVGVISMVLDDHEKGKLILRGNDYDFSETSVIAVYAPDHPGGLNAVLNPLKESDVNVDKMYISVARKGEHALLILEVSDNQKATDALKANYVKLVEGEFKF
jgi:hypothetical protein